MASVSTSSNGLRTVLFLHPGSKKRRKLCLGRASLKVANEVKTKIEYILSALTANQPIDQVTADWLAKLPDETHKKFAMAGLVPHRKSQRLGEFLDGYLELRSRDGKPNTISNMRTVVTDLKQVLGAHTPLREITHEHAEQFKVHYISKELAQYTICRQLKHAKHFFKIALDSKLVTENPFSRVRGKNFKPTDRMYYLSVEDTHRLIRAANPAWQTVIALCRFAGLRCPSEVLSLKWEDVNFAENRMVVTAPKTSHIEGKEKRVVPIFTALQPFLRDAFEMADPGEVYVIGGKTGETYRMSAAKGWKGSNMRTQIERIIHRAGMVAWPKPFHAMRSSCETDLASRFPIHVTTAWIGNTPAIALTHYLQTLESDFQKATTAGAESGAHRVQNRVQTTADSISLGSHENEKALENQGNCRVQSNPVHYCTVEQLRPEGFEQVIKTSGKPITSISQGAESGALSAQALLTLIASLAPDQRKALATLLLGDVGANCEI